MGYPQAQFGSGSGPIFLDQVGCTGDEATLGECPSNPVGVHDCHHFEDAGVGCYGVLSYSRMLQMFFLCASFKNLFMHYV